MDRDAFGKAEAVLREAIISDPDDEQRRLALADFLVNRKDLVGAERVLHDAAVHLPHASHIQFGLAALYRKSEQDEKARERYSALVQEFKNGPVGLEAKVRLAEMDLLAGKQVDAERQVQEVLKENPRSSDGLILSGRMALARRDAKDAVQAIPHGPARSTRTRDGPLSTGPGLPDLWRNQSGEGKS